MNLLRTSRPKTNSSALSLQSDLIDTVPEYAGNAVSRTVQR
jgi:hypothetical protein